MHIGEIIREHRKRKSMTQEEMANRLGVTAPAVNKWENGVSQPDIMLLTPIARLLGITLDTLLSFQEELTADGINGIIYEIDTLLKEKPYEEAFQWAKAKIQQYPNCDQLIWQLAVILDAQRFVQNIPDAEKYEGYIMNCYSRALESNDENIRKTAADSLFGFYFRKNEYQKAEEYLQYFSSENPEKKHKQALIYSKTNRIKEAYKAYEELLFSGCQMMNMVFHSIFMLAMEDNDSEKAHMLMEKQSKLANLFDMGKYQEAACKLELATAEKDMDVTIMTMEEILANIDKMCDYTNSPLYAHMNFKELDPGFIAGLREKLLACFRDEETYDYMKKNQRWQELIGN